MAIASYPTALRDARLNAATRSGIGMLRSVGCRDQIDFGADEEFGLAAQIVGNHTYATTSGVGFVAIAFYPMALRDAGLNAATRSGVEIGYCRVRWLAGNRMILVQTKNLGLAALIVGNHAYATRAGVGFVAPLNPTALRDAGLNAATRSGVGMPCAPRK